jgi:hypothetical protein
MLLKCLYDAPFIAWLVHAHGQDDVFLGAAETLARLENVHARRRRSADERSRRDGRERGAAGRDGNSKRSQGSHCAAHAGRERPELAFVGLREAGGRKIGNGNPAAADVALQHRGHAVGAEPRRHERGQGMVQMLAIQEYTIDFAYRFFGLDAVERLALPPARRFWGMAIPPGVSL